MNATEATPSASLLVPQAIGIGWRQPHYTSVVEAPPAGLGFLEVHSENFFGAGGAALTVLEQGRAQYPLSLHGVGLSLGSAAGLDPWHLDQLTRLVERIEPALVSDHASFARIQKGTTTLHASDLLPVPFSEAALQVMVSNVLQVQDRLKRPIAVENLSAYVHWPDPELSEAAFLNELARRSGCHLLVDVNNVMVNALNEARQRHTTSTPDGDACEQAVMQRCRHWLDALHSEHIAEFHLAGHLDCGDVVIDDHGSRVSPSVWQLYRHAIAAHGPRPTLIEWDTDVPALDVLLAEVALARHHQQCATGGESAFNDTTRDTAEVTA